MVSESSGSSSESSKYSSVGSDLTATGVGRRETKGKIGGVRERGRPITGMDEGMPLQKQREKVSEGLTQSVEGLCWKSQS